MQGNLGQKLTNGSKNDPKYPKIIREISPQMAQAKRQDLLTDTGADAATK